MGQNHRYSRNGETRGRRRAAPRRHRHDEICTVLARRPEMSAPASEQESAYGVALPVPAPAPALAPATRSHDMAAGAWPVAKRTLDLLLAVLGVIAFLPVML